MDGGGLWGSPPPAAQVPVPVVHQQQLHQQPHPAQQQQQAQVQAQAQQQQQHQQQQAQAQQQQAQHQQQQVQQQAAAAAAAQQQQQQQQQQHVPQQGYSLNFRPQQAPMLAPAGPPPPQHPLHQAGLFPAPGSLPQPHIAQAPVGAAPGTAMPFASFAQAPGAAGPVVDRSAAAPGTAGTGAGATGGAGTAAGGAGAGAGTTSSAGAAGAGAGGYFGGQTHSGQAPVATPHVGAPGNGYPAHGGRSQTGRREGGKGHFYRGPRPALSMEPVVNLSGSYVKTDGLLPLDEEGFKAAGVLPWRVTVSGSIEVLLGLSRRNELSIFGGMREQNEAPVETALREFRAETNGVLDDGSIVADIRRDLSRGPVVVWMLGGKYALYPFNVGTLSLMTIRQIVDLPVTIPRSITKAQDPAQQGTAGAGGSHTSEMEGARWVDLAALTLSLPRMSFHRFITSMVSSDPAFKAWAQDPVHATSTEPFEVKKCLPCRYWEAGTCAKGDTCDYMHAGQSGKARPARKIRCRFFNLGHCKNGLACPFAHQQQ